MGSSGCNIPGHGNAVGQRLSSWPIPTLAASTFPECNLLSIPDNMRAGSPPSLPPALALTRWRRTDICSTSSAFSVLGSSMVDVGGLAGWGQGAHGQPSAVVRSAHTHALCLCGLPTSEPVLLLFPLPGRAALLKQGRHHSPPLAPPPAPSSTVTHHKLSSVRVTHQTAYWRRVVIREVTAVRSILKP